MNGYGEEFLGVGYSQPSDEALEANGSAQNGIEATNSDGQQGDANNSQPVFVVAQRHEGNNQAITQMPDSQQLQQQQQQQQLQKNAQLARSKAQDILRNIMNGINSSETDGKHTTLARHNQVDDNAGPITTNQQHNQNYYRPEVGSTNTPYVIEPTSIDAEVQIARSKAMDILRKFQSQTNEHGTSDSFGAAVGTNSLRQSIAPEPSMSHYGPPETSRIEMSSSIAQYTTQNQEQHFPASQSIPSQIQPQSPMQTSEVPLVITTATTPPWELAKRRREALEKHEERKQRAMFKNLQYVARLEEERLGRQLEEIKQVKTLEQQIDERYQQKMEYRKKIRDGSNNINTIGAGIGTKQRRKAEAQRQKDALPQSLRKNSGKGKRSNNQNGANNRGSDSVAIYISNLPTDGSLDESTINALFSAYGTLRKIHFYVDKVTGKRKGDALVIYSLTEEQDEGVLTESVCSQVGARSNRRKCQ